MKAKIAVFVSGGGTNLQALIDAQKSGIIESGEIVLVVSNSAGAYALERAANNGIKSEVVLKKELGILPCVGAGVLGFEVGIGGRLVAQQRRGDRHSGRCRHDPAEVQGAGHD